MSILYTLLIGILAILLVYLAATLWRDGRYYYLGFKLPRRRNEWPIVGSTLALLGSLEHASKKGIAIYEENRDKPVFYSCTGPILWVILTDPDIAHKVLVHDLHKGFFYSFLGGRGLLEQRSLQKWTKHRKLINSSFHLSNLRSYVRIFYEEALIWTSKMEPFCGEPIDASNLVVLTSLGSFVRAMYGVDLNIQQKYEFDHPYVNAVESSFQIFIIRLTRPWLLLDTFYKLCGHKARVQANQITQRQFIGNIIEKIRERICDENNNRIGREKTSEETKDICVEPQEICSDIGDEKHISNLPQEISNDIGNRPTGPNEVSSVVNSASIVENKTSSTQNGPSITQNEGSTFPKHPSKTGNHSAQNGTSTFRESTDSFIDSDFDSHGSFVETNLRQKLANSMDNGRSGMSDTMMSDRELFQEMLGLTNGGFDTLRTATSVTLILLAIHPEIQEQVYDEIIRVLDDNMDKAPTAEQLLQLNLLTRVIKEALRLFPGIGMVARSAAQEMDCGGHIVPAGATLVVFIFGIHRDPKFWPNPNQFDPDRFLPSASDQRNPNAYLPFSLGPRNCIGYKYAMMYLQTTLSTILKRYKIRPGDRVRSVEDIRFEFGMTLRLLPGNDVRMEVRR